MTRYTLLILIAVSVLAGACAGRKNKVVRKNAIPDKDLVSILTEIHITDGLLSLPEINYLYADRDSVSSYVGIIEKYGYTREMMDRTMRYYFIKKPKKLVKIYDKVLGTLSEMESRIDKEMPSFRNIEFNFWQGKTSFNFPDISRTDSMWFDFPLRYTGAYYLRFTLTVYPDDETSNPKAGIFYSYPDSVTESERIYLSRFPFLKDGLPHTYNFRININKPVPPRLMGWFIDQENQSPSRWKHFRIDSVILSRPVR